jgi:hypothetical protein
MRTMMGLTTLLLVMTTPTLATGLYRCHAKDAVSLEDDGTLGRDKRWPSMHKRYETIIVDTATGTVRLGNDTPQTWTVLGNGGPDEDFVVAAAPHDPSQAASDIIRIRAWKDMKDVLFIWYGLSSVVTGTCEPIQ